MDAGCTAPMPLPMDAGCTLQSVADASRGRGTECTEVGLMHLGFKRFAPHPQPHTLTHPGPRPGMPRSLAGAAGLQTLHTKLPYITPSMTMSSNNMGAAWR